MTTTQRGESYRGRERVDANGHGETERVSKRVTRATLVALGCVLVVAGIRRRSRRGTALVIVGGLLLSTAFGWTGRLQAVVDERIPRRRQTGDRTAGTGTTGASRSITVGKPPEDLYEFWRDADNVSSVLGPFVDVTSSDGDRFRWTIEGPAGREVAWETQFVAEEHGEHLRWETPGDAILPNEGSIRFTPASGDRGTVATLSVDFDPPGGSIGTATLEQFDIVPETLVATALDRFKSLAETGEVPTLERNPSGRGRGDRL